MEATPAFPWIFALHLETFHLVKAHPSIRPILLQIVEDIQPAKAAAAIEQDYYGDKSNNNKAGHEQQQNYLGLILARKIRSLEIHAPCMAQDRDVAFFLNKIDALERYAVKIQDQGMKAFCGAGSA